MAKDTVSNRDWLLLFLKALFSFIFGALVIMYLKDTLVLLYVFLGIYLIVDGLLHISTSVIKEKSNETQWSSVLGGIVSIIIGLIFLLGSGKFIELLIYAFAIKTLLESVVRITTIIRNRKESAIKKNALSVIESLILTLVSIFILINPITGTLVVFYAIGVYALVTGFFHSIVLWREKPKKLNLSLYKKYFTNWTVTSISYAIALALSSIFAIKLLNYDFERILNTASSSSRETLAILIIVAIIFVFSFSTALIGTWLMKFKRRKTKYQINYKYKEVVLRIGLGLGLSYTAIGIPSVLLIFSIAFVANDSVSIVQLGTITAIVGALIGLVFAIFLGYKKLSSNQLINAIGISTLLHAIGGFLVGTLIWSWLFKSNLNANSLSLVMLPIGLATGLSIGIILDSPWGKALRVSKKTLASSSLEKFLNSKTVKSRGIFKFMILVISMVLLFSVFDLLFLSKSSISSKVQLETNGTHWSKPIPIDAIPEILPTISQPYAITCEDNHLNITKNEKNVKAENFELNEYDCGGETTPLLSKDSKDIVHFIWQSKKSPSIIYESLLINEALTKPTIIINSQEVKQLLASRNGDLIELYGRDKNEKVFKMVYSPYTCDKETLEGINKIAVGISTRYHAGESTLPYCNNRFDTLIYSPNPNEAFSDQTPREGGAFEYIAEQIKEAEYEVLINNMWYSADEGEDSPGTVISQGIADLYQDLKANPEKYPKGIDIKIMLGNPPEVVLFKTETQLWSLIEDLRNAGIETMYDEEIGWDLQVANYAGFLPHSHVKSVVIDGKTTIATGINLTYNHFSKDHTATAGSDRVDNGIQITGPIAQSTLAAFDDMWLNSNRKHCSNLNPQFEDFWRLTCSDEKAKVAHTPEVLRFYVPEDLNSSNYSTSHSLYRSSKFEEADDVISNTIKGSNKTIDIIQVNFSLDMICGLNVLIEVCDYSNSLEYMESIMSAVENNGSKIRVLTKKGPIEGVENKIAIEIFRKELKARGLEDLVEIREFNGDFHSKTVQIDNEFLIIGSQNFHYSAWGESKGLTEYSLTTDNSEANKEFKKFFEYHWEQSLDLGF